VLAGLYLPSMLYSYDTQQEPQLEESSTFILSSWSYPDEYGQGIYSITPDENSTGVWSHIIEGTGFIYSNSTDNLFTVVSNASLRLDVRVTVNYTLLGVSDPDLLNYIRVNLTVTESDIVTYSISNMTYDYLGGDLGDGLYWYSFVDILNFQTVSGAIYEIQITYEVYYGVE